MKILHLSLSRKRPHRSAPHPKARKPPVATAPRLGAQGRDMREPPACRKHRQKVLHAETEPQRPAVTAQPPVATAWPKHPQTQALCSPHLRGRVASAYERPLQLSPSLRKKPPVRNIGPRANPVDRGPPQQKLLRPQWSPQDPFQHGVLRNWRPVSLWMRNQLQQRRLQQPRRKRSPQSALGRRPNPLSCQQYSRPCFPLLQLQLQCSSKTLLRREFESHRSG